MALRQDQIIGSVLCRQVPSGFGWIATISKPILQPGIKLITWSYNDLEPAMTGQYFAIFDTAIGPCGIVWGERGISGVQLPMGSEDKSRKRIHQRNGDTPKAEPPAEEQGAIEAIRKLLMGKPNDLKDVVLDLEGVPEFNRGVYAIARAIPPGKTLTYGDIAKRLGGVELSRDVGQALGQNPCPVVVPCHRVLAAGGKPGGFSANGGVTTKLKMLAIEGAVVNHTPNLFD